MTFKFALIAAIILHVLLGFFLLVDINKHSSPTPMLHAYVSLQRQVNHKNMGYQRINQSLQTATPVVKYGKQGNLARPLISSKSQAAGNNKKLVVRLLLLLHQKIQANLHYPITATSLNKNGVTTIIFTLTMQGEIKHIHIKKSSGVAELDHIAVSTLQAINPINDVSHYLIKQQTFVINIEFN